jgi:hypothetical protein
MKRRLLAMFIGVIMIIAVLPAGVLAQPVLNPARINFYAEPSLELRSPEVLWIQDMNGDVTDIAVGDLNGDGKEDVAAIDNYGDKTLDILRGEGDGSGNPLVSWDEELSGLSVAIGDIDGDKVNEVVAHEAGYGVIAYENNGTEKWRHETLGEVKDIEIGDIDGNGINDVVVCDDEISPGAIYVIDGVSGSDLPGWPAIYPGEDFVDIALGQLNGSTGLEVAAISQYNNYTLMVFGNNGARIWYQEISGRTVEIGDVDGDGDNEVVAGINDLLNQPEGYDIGIETGGGGVVAFAGADGTPLYGFQTHSFVMDVELGDLNGNRFDGVEVACIDRGGPSTLYAVDIDNETEQEMWYFPMSWNCDYYGESLAIGDVDRDYKNEVVACSSIAAHYVYAFDGLDNDGDGRGDMVWEPYPVVGDPIYIKITDLEIGDLNGDGNKDVVVGTNRYASGGAKVIALMGPESQVESATGAGEVFFDADPSSLEQDGLIALGVNDLPSDGRPNYRYPFGFFSFLITNLSLENPQTVTITVTLPREAPRGTKWVKYQDGEWSVLDIGDDDGDNIITYQVVDGGIGDADNTFNGEILEPGGPGYPIGRAVGGEVMGTNRLTLVLCIALAFGLMVGGTVLVLSRRKRS